MKYKSVLIMAFLIFAGSTVHAGSTSIDPDKKTAVLALGDSLTAGTQDAATLSATQINSWISQFVMQAKKALPVQYVMPLMNEKGERLNGLEYPTNLAVPGLEVEEALESTGTIDLIKGIPIDMAPYLEPISSGGNPVTPLDSLIKMMRKTQEEGMQRLLFIWIGSNNAIFDFTKEAVITPGVLNKNMLSPEEFAAKFDKLLGTIASELPDLMFVMTIPDILRSGFLFTVDDLKFFLKKNIPQNLLNPQSLIPLTSAAQMFMGLEAGVSAEVIIGNLDQSEIVDPDEQMLIRERIKAYNNAIRRAAGNYGAVLIDSDETINPLLYNGYEIDEGKRIFRSWGRGGLFSLDGIHPSNTGHALIANAVIRKVNEAAGINILPIDLLLVYSADPYRDLDGDGFVAGPTWPAERGSIASILRVFSDNNDRVPKK